MLRRYAPEDFALLARRLWARVEIVGSCWQWTGGVTDAGYGQLRLYRGPAIGVHRLAYLLVVGPIPDGLFVSIATDYGVSRPAVGHVVTGRRWRAVA